MPVTPYSRASFLSAIGNVSLRNAVKAATLNQNTAYDLVGQTVNNSATLVAETALKVQVAGNTTYLVYGNLPLSIAAAADNIKLDFAAGSATIVASTMGGTFTFALANGTSLIVPLTALNTAVNGGSTNAWINGSFEFLCQVAAGGTIQLEFAQATAAANNTTIGAGAYMCAMPLDHVIAQ